MAERRTFIRNGSNASWLARWVEATENTTLSFGCADMGWPVTVPQTLWQVEPRRAPVGEGKRDTC